MVGGVQPAVTRAGCPPRSQPRAKPGEGQLNGLRMALKTRCCCAALPEELVPPAIQPYDPRTFLPSRLMPVGNRSSGGRVFRGWENPPAKKRSSGLWYQVPLLIR